MMRFSRRAPSQANPERGWLGRLLYRSHLLVTNPGSPSASPGETAYVRVSRCDWRPSKASGSPSYAGSAGPRGRAARGDAKVARHGAEAARTALKRWSCRLPLSSGGLPGAGPVYVARRVCSPGRGSQRSRPLWLTAPLCGARLNCTRPRWDEAGTPDRSTSLPLCGLRRSCACEGVFAPVGCES